jgi:hypothetical protein
MKTWIAQAVEYWFARKHEQDLGVDESEAHELCWRCGCKRKLQKCHIVAKQFGGTDDVSNLIPLCALCHDEAPDVTDPDAIWEWIRATRSRFYESFWAQRAMDIATERGVDWSQVDVKKMELNLKECGLHFFQKTGGCHVKPASIAWAIMKAVNNKVQQ